MPGKDFEQQVRETLGTWRIEPSAGIWGRLEEGLARKKKRRRAFYVILLAGLLAGGALLLPEKAAYGPEYVAPAGNIQSADRQSLNSQPATSSPSINSSPGKGSMRKPTDEKQFAGQAGPYSSAYPKSRQQVSGKAGPSNTTRAFAGDAGSRRMVMPGGRAKVEQAEGNKAMTIAENSRPAFGHLAYVTPFPVADTIAARTIGINATAVTPSPAEPGQAEKYTRKKQWSFGLTAGAGRSAFTEGIGLAQAKSADLNAGPSTGSGVPPQGPSYEYRQDPSAGWEIGGWVRVAQSRKWSFTAGVSYMQLSTRTPVGQSLGDSSRSYYNGYASQVSSNSFSAGNQSEYRNRYHLLQLPVMAEWQMNPGRKLPVAWSMGLAPGYLLSSNALVRDSARALYSHPDNQRRFQLGVRTGLRFRLMPSSAHPLDIGPVLQYQLNEVFVNGIRDNGHLFYLGVEARVPLFFMSRMQR